jgi:uncharacterized membrane protein
MIVLVWVHLLAAVTWIGGMLFLTLVLVPVFKAESSEERRALFVRLARRFRVVVWISIAILIATGAFLVHPRTDSLLDPAGWPVALRLKLALVGLLLALTMAHDFWLGPRSARLTYERSAVDERLLRIAPWVGRGSLLVALGVLLAAVVLVRT